MVIMHNVLLITKQLSVSLQQVNIDLTRCLRKIQVVVDVITQMRNVDVEANFGKIFNEAEKLLGVGDAIKLPCTCCRQTYRGNAMQYYRTMVYIPFLDSLLLQFNDRFIAHRNTVFRLSGLLPRNAPNTSFEDLVKRSIATCLFYQYKVTVTCHRMLMTLKHLFFSWQVRWRDVPVDDHPTDCFDSLAVYDKQFYPNIYGLLQIFATLPVSTASAERTFSAMKLLKTYLLSTLSDENILGLALAFIHKQTVTVCVSV